MQESEKEPLVVIRKCGFCSGSGRTADVVSLDSYCASGKDEEYPQSRYSNPRGCFHCAGFGVVLRVFPGTDAGIQHCDTCQANTSIDCLVCDNKRYIIRIRIRCPNCAEPSEQQNTCEQCNGSTYIFQNYGKPEMTWPADKPVWIPSLWVFE